LLTRRRSVHFLLTKQSQALLDIFVLVAAFWLAYLLRFDFALPAKVRSDALVQLFIVVLIQFGALRLTRVHRFIWRYVGMPEARAFLNAALISALSVLILRISLPEAFQVARVPVSVILMDTLMGFMGVLGLRVLRRSMYERFEKRHDNGGKTNGQRKRTLLIGAGRAGVMAIREIRNRGDLELDVIGFIDDDPGKQGSVIQGVKVLGMTDDLPILVRKLNIEQVVISIAQASRHSFRRMLEICKNSQVKVQIIPGLYEILQGRVQVSRIRNIQIEDLLGREPVRLDEESIRSFITGKTVLVTGAGGSIGSELARQAARFGPARLLLVERAEFALFHIDRELRESFSDCPIIPLTADVGDESRMLAIFETYRPNVILHAAAHKHVPLMEHNPSEAIKNNVIGTHKLGEMAGQFGTDVFVLISTDKAVCPTSVMGASKRVAELVIQDLDRRYKTRYEAVRFGNVIGSAGSVIPIFREQIRKGGPVTVTHPEMRRYFMTIPEAAELVLEAGAMGTGGEIFILDMGEPVRILDLAKDIITLSGLKPYEDIDIVFTGIRPGEKLYEKLETAEEHVTKTRHPKIFIGKIAADSGEKLERSLARLATLAKHGKDDELRRLLNFILPEARLDVPVINTEHSVQEKVLAAKFAHGSSM
jgi:FlaA1/EpsC-like NDP-sugar epimerase